MAVETQKRVLTTTEAIREALAQEIERDENVFVMGEDVGTMGSVWGVTSGLQDQFGPERVIDTPISEAGFIGAAIGAALSGMRPVVELMYADFFGVCMDQIYNHMAKIHHKSGGQFTVPMVITTGIGCGLYDASQHSQTLYGLFGHLPGMKIVVPSTPYDAKGLLVAAIRDDNPVMYMFHKAILGGDWLAPNPRALGEVPENPYEVPIGEAEVKRIGGDVTIVTAALMVHRALDAAEILDGEGIDAEVIDLRSIVPLDREAIINSVKKTRRLLVVDEDYRSFGLTGEVITTVVEEAMDALVSPPMRLALPDVPISYSRPLEDALIPSIGRIVDAARHVVRHRQS